MFPPGKLEELLESSTVQPSTSVRRRRSCAVRQLSSAADTQAALLSSLLCDDSTALVIQMSEQNISHITVDVDDGGLTTHMDDGGLTTRG